jgi:hypothetical protein
MRPWRSRPRGRRSRALEEDFALTTNDVDEALGWPLRRDVRDGREHAIRLLDELSAGERPRWTLVDAAVDTKFRGRRQRRQRNSS